MIRTATAAAAVLALLATTAPAAAAMRGDKVTATYNTKSGKYCVRADQPQPNPAPLFRVLAVGALSARRRVA